MSRNAKIARTQIADLPEGVSPMSAAAMEHVAGGAINLGFTRYNTCPSDLPKVTYPASITVPGKPDTATDCQK
jgi:hypothetical protein